MNASRGCLWLVVSTIMLWVALTYALILTFSKYV